ncbi:MAG: hypothetical protein HQL17_00900 [Candidatus Omnitrophica bacterium]|nr:hypothetical protein [Candidatus Omnitrophota bacterium]
MIYKKILVVTITTLVLAMQGTASALAETESRSFNLSATIPAASAVTIDVFKEFPPGDSVPISSDQLVFDLSFNGRYYSAGYYFRLNIKAQGAGDVTTVITYAEGQKPAGAIKGLGDVCVATFYKGNFATGGPGETLAAGGKLAGLNVTITPDQIKGGFLIMHFGLEAYGFVPQDAPGVYDGILTLTSTVN